MKSTFIYFGIFAAMISHSALGNGLAKGQNHSGNNAAKTAAGSTTDKFKKPNLDLASDTMETTTAIYIKTIEEVIAEDNKIIESELANSNLSAIEKVIMEDNQIIESNLTNEFFPLDFENLN